MWLDRHWDSHKWSLSLYQVTLRDWQPVMSVFVVIVGDIWQSVWVGQWRLVVCAGGVEESYEAVRLYGPAALTSTAASSTVWCLPRHRGSLKLFSRQRVGALIKETSHCTDMWCFPWHWVDAWKRRHILQLILFSRHRDGALNRFHRYVTCH